MAGSEGSVFGKFFLLKKIAAGGMGEIYLAKLRGPVGFEKLLVIKRILQHHLENQDFVDMFFAEARVAAKLSHSNVVQIYEMGEIEDCYYIAMEYVHGKSLRDLLDRARARGEYIHPAHVVEIISKVCEGLSYAHNATDMSGQAISVIHRDINPHNLLVSYSGEVKIIDFGIAKSQLSTNKTETGTIKGKFVYMSPEQSAAEPLDKRSDLFSVGICAYEAFTFVNPFAKPNVVLSLDAIQRADPPPLAQTNPKLAPLDPVLAKALAKKAGERYLDCLEFSQALHRLRETGVIENPPQTLKGFMHDLFEDQIESEKRMILETDSANTSQIQLMQKGLEREHQSGSHSGYRIKTQGRAAAHASPVVLAETLPHSRTPFLLLLVTIILVSGVAATVVYELTRRSRLAGQKPLTVAELMAPVASGNVPGPSRPDVTPTPTPEPPRPAVTSPEPAPPAKKAVEHDAGDDDERGTKKGPKKVKPAPPPRAPAKAAPTKATEPQPAVSPAPPPPTADPPPPPAAPPPPSFGSLQISTVPAVKILRDGTGVGQTFKLKGASGRLQIGGGTDPATDPFTVRIRYRVEGNDIVYTIESDPWAIVQGEGGLGLGKTPLANQVGGEKAVFNFINPQAKLALRVTLRFTR